MANEQKDQQGQPQTSSQLDQSVSRTDTLADGGSVPAQAPPRPTGADIAGAAGSDAAAGAQMAGSSGPGGASLREEMDSGDGKQLPGTPSGAMGGGGSPGAGANAAGGTGLGDASHADTTSPGTGTTQGQGTATAGGNPASNGPPPADADTALGP